MYDTIVVGTDRSDAAEHALDHAIGLARHHNASVHVLMVVERNPHDLVFGVADVEELNHAVEDLIAEIEDAHAADTINVTGDVRQGTPSTAVLSYAHDVNADLVVVGQQGAQTFEQRLLGSTADRLARSTDIPLTIIPRS